MVAFSPSTSPDSEILVMMVLPSLDEVESFALPVQRTKTPRGRWPSMNRTADLGYTAVDLISFSFCKAGRGRLQKRCSSRTGQATQSSRMLRPYGERIAVPSQKSVSPCKKPPVIRITESRDPVYRDKAGVHPRIPIEA